MQLNVKVSYLKEFESDVIKRVVSYRSDDQFVDIGTERFTKAQLDRLYEKAKADMGKPDQARSGARALAQKISAYRNIQQNPSGHPIKKLNLLEEALREYIKPSPNKWLFSDEKDGYAVPYYVSHISYEKNDPRRGIQAHVSVRLAAVTRGNSEGETITFHMDNLGSTVSEILNAKGYYLETKAAVETYWQDIELYKTMAPATGAQFTCQGTGFPTGYYSYGEVAMERDGQPAKVVMDDDDEEEEDGRSTSQHSSGTTTSNKYWKTPGHNDEDDGSDEDDEGEVVTPVHPYVKVFDLDRHLFVRVHVRNLTAYVYDKTAAAKLILPEDTKNLVHILVQGSSDVLEDIIQGKTGGTIVIATGPPGTGKTLTAEVFAEEIHCPLYVVQCSQLGTDEEKVEKQLTKVLARASRWRAILLIDEADVYVHTRGTDIQQNAIVGVFLRVLEHYRGVLFLTSNRSTVIDDAIMSRATAWIRYEYPSAEQLGEIWHVLSEQYRMPLPKKIVEGLVEAFPRLSGRNIKNLLKLARMLLARTRPDSKLKAEPNVKLFQYVSSFLDLKPDTKEGVP
jgi:hypothetical protein